MKFRILLGSLIVVFFVVLSSCKGNDKKEQGSMTLAAVNGVPIMIDDVNLLLGGHGDFTSGAKDRVIEDLISQELLYQKGVKLGLDKDQKFQNAVRQLERRVVAYKRIEMARRVRDTQIASKVNVTDQDVRDYYEKHAELITTDLHLFVIQFPEEKQAKEALNTIRSGVPFEKVAAQKLPHAKKGERPWDKGFLRWNEIPAELVGVYSLKKGDVSDVFNAGKMGFYILKVMDRRKNPAAGLENMAASIMNRLNSIKIAEAYDRYVQQLKKDASIKRYGSEEAAK